MGEAPARSVIVYDPTSSPEPHVSSSYPVSSHAVPVSAGMMVAVPLGLVASPLRNGRDLGGRGPVRAGHRGDGEDRRGRGRGVLKVVAVAEAQVKRDGQVRAKGSPVHHATLGPLEERLDSAGPGIAGRSRGGGADARFVKGRAGKAAGQGVHGPGDRVMTLMPGARIRDVIAALAGDLALVPWARPWRPASARAAGDWRSALGPGRWRSCGTSCPARPGGSTRSGAVPVR